VDLRVFDKSESPVNYEIIYSGDDVFNPKSESASEAIEIGKLNNATVAVEIIEGEFGHSTTIKVTVPKDGDGNVTIYVDGVPTVIVPDENGVAVLNVTETVGPHTVNVTYTNSTKYNDKDWNGSFNVSKDSHYDFNITVEPSEIKYGDNVTITVSAPEGVHEVNLTIDGETVTIPIGSDGKGNHTVTNFTAGPHTVEIDFNGNENYTEAHNSTSFTIDKTQPDTFKVDISEPNNVGDTVNVTVTLPEDATGTVTVKVNGTEYSGKVENGTVTVIIPKLGNGTYPVNVTYSGDSNYDAIYNDTESIVVDKNVPEISAVTSPIKRGDAAIVNVTIPGDATGTVTVEIGGVTKTVAVTGGVNSISVEGIPVGENQTVKVTYNGDDKYTPNTYETSLTVLPKDTGADDFKVDDKGNGTIIVTAPEGATGKVNLTIGNETYEANITDGKAIFDIANKTDQTPGVHDITLTYSGDENNTAVEFNSTANVPKWDSQVNVNVPTIRQGDVAKVNVTVTSPEGRGYTPNGTVRVKVDGKEGYFGTLDENGQAIIEV
ncbi:Ig-like domain-containing protein, partial [Methanobrevibacter sp.]